MTSNLKCICTAPFAMWCNIFTRAITGSEGDGGQNSAYYNSQAPRTMPSWHIVQMNDYVAADTWIRDFICRKLGFAYCISKKSFWILPNWMYWNVKKSLVFVLIFEEGKIRKWERKKERGKMVNWKDQGWERARECSRPCAREPLIFCFTQTESRDFSPLLVLSIPRLSLVCARCVFPGS